MADPTLASLIGALLLGGIMGTVGQGARAVVGLKKMNDDAQAKGASWSDVFIASRLLISLVIGFIAGVIAAIAMLDKIVGADAKLGVDLLLGLAAAGYAGADTIEAFISKISNQPQGQANPPRPNQNQQPPAQDPQELGSHIVNLSAALNSTKAMLADLQMTTTAVSGAGAGNASAAELARDMAEAKKYMGAITAAATRHNLAPSLICAIGSRESNWGLGSDMHPKGPAGTGDWAPRDPARWGYAMPPDGKGWGRGLMQVDYAQSDFGKTGRWYDPTENVEFGANELAGNIAHYQAHPPGPADPLRAAVAAYNCGRGNVDRAVANNQDVDSRTTGHDYSRDVLARAAWFKAHGFDQEDTET